MKDYAKLIVQGWPYENLCKISYLSIPWNFSLLEFILKNSMSKNKIFLKFPKDSLVSFTIFLFFGKKFENFNTYTNNMINVQDAKVLGYLLLV